MNKFRPLDFLVFATIAIISVCLIKKSFSENGNTVKVSANGKNYEYSLAKNGTHSVTGALGKTVFQIENRKVRIISSPCSGKNCITQGWHAPLVCLPNKVIISIENYGEFDAVSE